MKKVDYKEIVNLLNSSDIEVIKLGLSYLLDLNLIDKETFQRIMFGNRCRKQTIFYEICLS